MSSKASQMPSWHQSIIEKRMLRKRRIGPADVYFAENDQENSSNYERVCKGYQANVMPYEYESLVYNSHYATLNRLDEAHAKSTELLALVLRKRCEMSASLDKERRKNKEMVGARLVFTKAKERAAWFTDLAQGKMLHKLAKTIPKIKSKEESLEYLCDYRVPTYRALWYLKVTAALGECLSRAKNYDSACEIFSADYRDLFVKSIRKMVAQMLDISDLSTSHIYKDRWLYISNLSKCAFADGIIERQGFLNGLCDIFFDYFISRSTNGRLSQLKVYLLFLTQFLRHITNNFLLTRRLAHMIVTKLYLYHIRYDEKHNRATRASEALAALTGCAAYRPIIHTLSAILQNMVIDAPEAFVWNKFKAATVNELPCSLLSLYGSPLDLLPCAVHELPVPSGKGSEQFLQLLELRTIEIVRRSQAVQNNWQFNLEERYPFAKLVNACIDVVGILDSMDVLEPGIIPTVTTQIFGTRLTRCEEEVMIRIKLMLQWAVTAEREGTHRAAVVAKIIHQQILNQGSHKFGRFHLQNIILDYFDTEAPTPGSRSYEQEFAFLVLLLTELSRFKLFDHDSFVKELIKTGDLDYRHPIIEKLKYDNISTDIPTSCQFEDLTPDEPADIDLLTHKQEEKDEHAYLYDAMPTRHRILIHMPLYESEEHRNEINQRALFLYGIGDVREDHITKVKQISRKICKFWQKKVYVKFERDKAPFWKHSACPQTIAQILASFKHQTYYDQAMICSWCAESFSTMIHEFIQGYSLMMPTSVGLDLLCGMFEAAQHINGIFELSAAIIPLLSYAERVVCSLASDVIPGTLSGQMGYVFVAYISKHWLYFLHSSLAPTIINRLYKMIEPMLHAYEYPMTSWGRTIAAFVYHSKSQLKKSQLTDIKLYGTRESFRNVFNHGSGSYAVGDKYSDLFFMDVFEMNLQFFSYHEYKKRLSSFGQLYNRYSFVINAFIAAKECMRNYDRLSELATFCGHISAQIPQLAEYWIAAIKALCSPNTSQTVGYSELLAHIDVTDCSTHYPISTFVMLLAGKYAFSLPRLIAELLNTVFTNVMERESSSAGESEFDYEPGACMALLILAKTSCATDEPFHLSHHYVGENSKNKFLPKCADEIILSMIHWCEMDSVLFPMLSSIFMIIDALRARLKDLKLKPSPNFDSTKYRREYFAIIQKAVQQVICEEDWVTLKMFRIAETNGMQAFDHESLKRNCIGQHLLRFSLRRKSERGVLSELTICSENSKKLVIRKWLTTLNMWNVRATLFELMLMIKEVPPKNVTEGDALMSEIAKCCCELFVDVQEENSGSFSAVSRRDFRFHHVTNFWLVAFLVRLCPQLKSASQFQHKSVSEKCVKEVLSILNNGDSSLEEKGDHTIFLLSQQAFLNFLSSCLERDDLQANKDILISSLYNQLRDLMNEAKKGYRRLEKFRFQYEKSLLLLSLVSTFFREICKPQHNKRWSQLLFKILLYGVVSPGKNRLLYDSCYDMLSTLILCALTTPSTGAQNLSQHNKAEFESYSDSVVIKELKKKMTHRRVPSDLRDLLRLLPIPKRVIPVLEMKSYGVVSVTENPNSSSELSKSLRGRHGLNVSKKMRLSSFDFIDTYINAENTISGWKWYWFQASKIDRFPYPVQKWVGKLLFHRHQSEYQRSNVVVTKSDRSFLSAADMEEATTNTLLPLDSAVSAKSPETKATPAVADASGATTEVTTSSTLPVSVTASDDMISDQDHSRVSSQSCKRVAVKRQHSSKSRQKKARTDSTSSSVSSFDVSRTLSDARSALYTSSQMSGTVKGPTKVKLQECINRKFSGAEQVVRIPEFTRLYAAVSSAVPPPQVSYLVTQQQMPLVTSQPPHYPQAAQGHVQTSRNAHSDLVSTSYPRLVRDWQLSEQSHRLTQNAVDQSSYRSNSANIGIQQGLYGSEEQTFDLHKINQ